MASNKNTIRFVQGKYENDISNVTRKTELIELISHLKWPPTTISQLIEKSAKNI